MLFCGLKRRLKHRFAAFGLSLALAMSSMFFKPHGICLVAFLVTVFGWQVFSEWKKKQLDRTKIVAATVSGFILLGAFLFQVVQTERYDGLTARTFSKKLLFCFASPPVVQYLRESDYKVAGYSPEFLRKVADKLQGYLDQGPGGSYRLLGFVGDYCLAGADFDQLIRSVFKDPEGREEAGFYSAIYRRAMISHPSYLLSKVFKQISFVASHSTYFHSQKIEFTSSTFKTEGHLIQKYLPPPGEMSLGGESQGLLSQDSWAENLSLRLLRSAGKISAWLVPLGILLIFGLIAVRIRKPKLQDHLLFRAAFATAAMTVFYLCALLASAIAHSFDVWRYHVATVGMDLVLVAQGMSFVVLVGAMGCSRLYQLSVKRSR